MSKVIAVRALTTFFELSDAAAENGGYWVSDGQGTKNIIAGEISRLSECKYDVVKKLLNEAGITWFKKTFSDIDEDDKECSEDDWYCGLAQVQGGSDRNNRAWEAKLIARNACAKVLRNRKHKPKKKKEIKVNEPIPANKIVIAPGAIKIKK
ncbi:MAG: hypothetical protein DRH08_01805 [Deltaproteobacteria bacterium]|nr:MAG: hypothetical protein DRH08_01805 [Deltaproteobacteria bacterium]